MTTPTWTLHVTERAPRTILWVPAFPLDGSMWSAQLEGIDGVVHLAPDLPGFGASAAIGPDAMSMDAIADQLAALLTARGIERAIVAGCSMGGYVALALARRHPSRLRGLVLADTRAEADSEEGRAGREQFAQTVLAKGSGAARDALVPKLVADPNGPAAARVAAMIERATPEGIAAAARGMAVRADSRPGLAAIAVPTLVVVGEHDGLTPPPLSEALAAAIPGAQLVVIPGAGHLSPLEAPEAFNAAVRGWLDSTR